MKIRPVRTDGQTDASKLTVYVFSRFCEPA
jgi:hypothetical protein